jgi:RHS repeat-associated protein
VSGVDYDGLGRRTKVYMPPGDRSYEYASATQRLTKDRFEAGEASDYWIEHDYGVAHAGRDPLGNLVDVRGGTSVPGDPVFAATYSYDRRNRLSSWTPSGGATRHYSHDLLGNLVGYATATAGAQNQAFGGANGPPCAVTSSTASGSAVAYTFDADGNLASAIGTTQRHYSFDWANRLAKVGTSPGSSSQLSVAYDADGSRISDLRPGIGQRVYVGDLATFHRASTSSSSFDSAELHIFAFGETIAYKRVQPVALRTAASIGGFPFPLPEPLLPYAPGLLVAVTSGGILLLGLRLRLHVPVARHPAVATTAWAMVLLVVVPPLPAGSGGGGAGTIRRWLVTDHLGSGTVWLDEDGTRVRHTEYEPFGRIASQVVAGDTVSPWLYAGHRYEFSSGFNYMKARWYSPATGTFVSIDPVVGNAADPQAYNAYAYARNNPILNIDPSGAYWADPGQYGNDHPNGGTHTTIGGSQAPSPGGSAGIGGVGPIGAAGPLGAGFGPAPGPGVGSPSSGGSTGPGAAQPQGTHGDHASTEVAPESRTRDPGGSESADGGAGRDTGAPSIDTTEIEKAMGMLSRWFGVNSQVPNTDIMVVEVLGYAWVLAGGTLLIVAGAVAIGVATPAAGVTAAGLGILGIGAVAIGGAYVVAGRAGRGG